MPDKLLLWMFREVSGFMIDYKGIVVIRHAFMLLIRKLNVRKLETNLSLKSFYL
jgi:hypothetical protein